MRKKSKLSLFDHYLECFGDLDLKDPVCRRYCALRLKCAIEQTEQNRLVQLEDMINAQEIPLTVQ